MRSEERRVGKEASREEQRQVLNPSPVARQLARRSGRSHEQDHFFFQAEDGIRDADVTGVQTCALPIFRQYIADQENPNPEVRSRRPLRAAQVVVSEVAGEPGWYRVTLNEIGRASCRERGEP